MPAHLADWYLTREQFETVPDRPGFYRLTDPGRDGTRRARQAVHDLRVQGFTVHADYTLDPASEHDLPELLATARQTRLARAATTRSPQLTTTASPVPPPAPAPAATADVRRAGRSR
ncbi:hypothetical protein AB0G74_22245 [Streptomyces sp. NPDC020875]|uniref:hypothetical protein n=1 Tax=Streptomyces sp. NPDC020875 TaxID=3154898 RepID=UPI0033D6126C